MTRIVRSRFLAGLTAGALTASLGLPGVATAAPKHRSAPVCALRSLPLPADMDGRAEAVDPTGRFVVGLGYRITDDDFQPLLLLWAAPPIRSAPGVWNEPRLTVVAMGAAQEVRDINRYGVVVGNAVVDNSYRPWRYRNGHLEWLPVPTMVSGTWALGINARGDIVGQGAVEQTETTLALLWPADRPGTVEVIDAPAYASAREILDDGTIVGNAADFGWVRHPDARIDRLTAPGAQWSGVSAAQGTWVVGHIGTGGGDSAMVRWDLRTGVATAVNPALVSMQGVNIRGTVLGDRAVDHGDRLVALGGAIPGVLDTFGWAIADNGLVVGSTNGSRLRPARWTNC
ncbi:hypothetical protein [Micromonospora sp. LH3U1]|uniref:hypothetical protein n=1 Tax=Micromonospora sp. LH3U1 TaxID=3018339 RepID=UPI00234AF5E0|nr:hypothetical protein [Micromonospora sp. LH3U1]WCN83246.1 hypothetical protein PCA76_09430 [Micromonospora sp. LH3U1]